MPSSTLYSSMHHHFLRRRLYAMMASCMPRPIISVRGKQRWPELMLEHRCRLLRGRAPAECHGALFAHAWRSSASGLRAMAISCRFRAQPTRRCATAGDGVDKCMALADAERRSPRRCWHSATSIPANVPRRINRIFDDRQTRAPPHQLSPNIGGACRASASRRFSNMPRLMLRFALARRDQRPIAEEATATIIVITRTMRAPGHSTSRRRERRGFELRRAELHACRRIFRRVMVIIVIKGDADADK